MIATGSLVQVDQAEEMTYGLHKQQQATSTGDTANFSPERLAAMQRQKDKYGFSVYAAHKGVGSVNNTTTSTGTAPAPQSNTVPVNTADFAPDTTATINTDTTTTSGADPAMDTSSGNPVDPATSPDEGAAQSAPASPSAEGCASDAEATGCKETYLRH